MPSFQEIIRNKTFGLSQSKKYWKTHSALPTCGFTFKAETGNVNFLLKKVTILKFYNIAKHRLVGAARFSLPFLSLKNHRIGAYKHKLQNRARISVE